MKNTTILTVLVILIMVIGGFVGYSLYTSNPTPTNTLSQIEKQADRGDYEAFKDCCFDEDIIISNIRQDIEASLTDDEIVLARQMIEQELTSARNGLEADFKQGRLFREFDLTTIKENSNGFTIEAKGKEGNKNLITFQTIDGSFKMVQIRTID